MSDADSLPVEVEGDPDCAHRWQVYGISPDDTLYRCHDCKRQQWGAG